MNYVNRAFIKVFRGHEASSADDGPHEDRQEDQAARTLQQAQGTCVVGPWTGDDQSAAGDGTSSGAPERSASSSEGLRSGSHLPAVLAAAAAAGEPDLSQFQDRLAGVEYLRRFVPLPHARSRSDISPRGRTDTPFRPAAASPAPRAKVILVNEPSHAVPAPHFDVATVAETPGSSEQTRHISAPPQHVPEAAQNIPAPPQHVPEAAQNISAPPQHVPEAAQNIPVPLQHVPEAAQNIPAPLQNPADPPVKPPESPQAESHDAGSDEGPFRPAWEVDSFEWPSAIGQMFTEQPHRFDALAEQIIELADAGSKRIAIIGSCPGAGSTTLALCLARRLSEVVQEVALVDGNFSNPCLAAELDVRLDAGWEDVLTGRQIPEEVAVTSVENGITLLPLLNSELDSNVAAADRVARVQQRLAAHHDIVLVDAGPIWGRGIALFASGEDQAAVDAAVLVRDVRQTAERELKVAVAELASRGVAVVAIAENFQESDLAEDTRRAA